MPKYLLQVKYSHQGIKGLAAQGGSAREAAARELIESVGGRMDAFYFAFGEHDVYVIADFPDHASATAAALAVGGSGAGSAATTVLMTPAEVDEAARKQVTYRPPGG
jgi:uncharacterized protein with GYD domain